MALSTIKFFRGLKSRYKPESIHKDGIYFTLDSPHEILVNGTSYGSGSEIDLTNYVTMETLNSMLTGYIKSAQYDSDTCTLTFLNTNNSPVGTPITFSKASSTSDGFMSKEDKKKLDTVQEGAQANVIDNVETDLGTVSLLEKTARLNLKVAVESIVNDKVAGIYKFKGSVSSSGELPTEGNEVGDVWSVESPSTIEDKTYPAGTNFAWTSSDKWDSLGGIVSEGLEGDVAALEAKVTEIENKFTGDTQTTGTVRNIAFDVASSEVLVWNEATE